MINFCTKINVPKCRENISITKMSLPFDECNDDLPSTFSMWSTLLFNLEGGASFYRLTTANHNRACSSGPMRRYLRIFHNPSLLQVSSMVKFSI